MSPAVPGWLQSRTSCIQHWRKGGDDESMYQSCTIVMNCIDRVTTIDVHYNGFNGNLRFRSKETREEFFNESA